MIIHITILIRNPRTHPHPFVITPFLQAPAPTVAFKLLSRDTRGRVETRQLLVPEEAPMAVKLAKAEAAMRLEKQKLKVILTLTKLAIAILILTFNPLI